MYSGNIPVESRASDLQSKMHRRMDDKREVASSKVKQGCWRRLLSDVEWREDLGNGNKLEGRSSW